MYVFESISHEEWYLFFNPFGTIGLTTAIFFLLGSPVLLALLYMGQPPSSVILQDTVYISQVVYAYFVSNWRCSAVVSTKLVRHFSAKY